MAELNIEEAREIYKKSDELKSLMLAKFSKEELEKNDVSQEEFDKTFLELLGKCTKMTFLDELGYPSEFPTNRIELQNADNEWMLDIQFTGGHKHFYMNYYSVWKIFKDKYDMQDEDIQRLMKNQLANRFGMDDVTAVTPSKQRAYEWVNRFGMDVITPLCVFKRLCQRMKQRFGITGD